jgi:hypothetical protein
MNAQTGGSDPGNVPHRQWEANVRFRGKALGTDPPEPKIKQQIVLGVHCLAVAARTSVG